MSAATAAEACAEHTEKLCHWAAATTLADIPDAVLEKAARVLADDLAAIVGAAGEPEVACFHEKVLSRHGAPEATVFRGGRPRTERTWAAVANAVAAKIFLRERVDRRRWMAALLVAGGVALLAY